ncbi:MAG: hypothetical protein WCR86_06355 [Parabacteroides sp.]
MEEKKKATLTAAEKQELHYKDNNNQRIIITIKGLFLSGRKLTAKQINEITGSNDARKGISNLRRKGWQITDMLLPNRCKLYWLAKDDKRLNLFKKEEQK